MAGRCVDTGSAGDEPRGSHADKCTITEHLTPLAIHWPRERKLEDTWEAQFRRSGHSADMEEPQTSQVGYP